MEAFHSDVFLVIDNSGWYQSLTNAQTEEGVPAGDVIFEMELTTTYSDNQGYNFLFLTACITIAVLIVTLLIVMVAYKCQRMQYAKLME